MSAGAKDIFVAELDAGGKHVWSSRFGDAAAQVASHVAVDSDGNAVVTGSFSGTLDFGGGTPLVSTGKDDIFVAKLDAGGHHLWSQSFGGPGTDGGQGIAVDGVGNVVVTAAFYGSVDFGGGPIGGDSGRNVAVVKLDAGAGGHLWSRGFGPAVPFLDAFGVAVDPAYSIFVVGDFSGSVDFGGGPLSSAGGTDIFVAKFTP